MENQEVVILYGVLGSWVGSEPLANVEEARDVLAALDPMVACGNIWIVPARDAGRYEGEDAIEVTPWRAYTAKGELRSNGVERKRDPRVRYDPANYYDDYDDEEDGDTEPQFEEDSGEPLRR